MPRVLIPKIEGPADEPGRLAARLRQVGGLGASICTALAGQIGRLGCENNQVVLPDWGQAAFALSRDPASGEDALLGVWRDARGAKVGEVVIHADGSFFAEQDVVRAYPRRPGWFVEAVTAWGREGSVKAEPRLLPMPE